VVPHNRLITITMEITEQGRDAAGPFAVADASLWVDGKRIYQVAGIGMKIIDANSHGNPQRVPIPSRDGAPPAKPAGSPRDHDGNPQRVPIPSRDGAPPAKPAGSPRDHDGNPQRVPIPSRDGAPPAKPAGSPRDNSGAGGWAARSTTAAELLPATRDYWRALLAGAAPPVEDICRGLVLRFLRQLHITDPEALQADRSGGVIFLANHQVTVESTIFAIVASAWMGAPLLTLARIENQTSWLDQFMQHAFSYPGLRSPRMSQYFDRSNSASLPGIIREMSAEMAASGRSVMVHVEGAMAHSCRTPVRKLSGAFVDMALALGRPVVPVRFVGGLPVAPVAHEIDFPVGMGQQDVYIGYPLASEQLRPLNYRDRRQRVIDAINQLGPPNHLEEPLPPEPAFAAAVHAWSEGTGASLGQATMFCILEQLSDRCPEIAGLLKGARAGELRVSSTPESRWLAELARRLFGPRGPRVIEG